MSRSRRVRRIQRLDEYPHSYVSLIAIREYFGIGRRTLDAWIECGLLKAYLLPGCGRRVKTTDLLAFEEKYRIEAAPIAQSINN